MNKCLTAGVMALMVGVTGVTSGEDDLTSLSYISYLERYATVRPATADDTLEAVLNMPLLAGDRIDTAREARVEVVLADGSLLWLDQYSSVSFDAIAMSRDTAGDRTVLFLAEGAIALSVPANAEAAEMVRVDARDATVHLAAPGLYVAQTLPSGGLRIDVWEGLAEVMTIAGAVSVRAGSAAEVSGGAIVGTTDHLTWEGQFAAWVDSRRQLPEGDSGRFVGDRHSRQAATLDSHGSWLWVDGVETYAWRPSVALDWQPYTYGRWYWTTTGWNWISYEPWGWLPYHYGSWYLDASFGWVWTWSPWWGPAWVNWVWWPGYVGWCPSGYYDWWYWDRYGHPGHGGGGGHPHPPRGDVNPPGRTGLPAANTGTIDAGRATLDLRGRVEVGQMDPTGWNVISSADFSSPHLPRLIESGDRVFRSRGGAGVVLSGPLLTESPGRAAPGDAIDRVFGEIRRSGGPDLTPVLGRDSTVPSATVRELARPTTPSSLASRTAPSPTQGGTISGRPVTGPSPPQGLDTSRTPVRREAPNLYRPSPSGTSASSGDGARIEARPTAPTSSRSPVVPNRTILRGGPVTRSTPAPTTGTVPRSGTTGPSGSPTAGRAPVSSSSLGPGSVSSRPVLVPRTSPSRPSRSIGSASPRPSAPRVSGGPSPTRPSASSGGSTVRSGSPSVRSPSSAQPSTPTISGTRPSSPSSGGGKSRR